MKSLRIYLLVPVLSLLTSCGPDPCESTECGPGDCIKGVCDCPDGFSGIHCEIEDCFGVECINGNCDPQSKTCDCDPDYYGESCDTLCVNGEFTNGDCHCAEGYEGNTCETEIRDRFLGWWNCEQWTITSPIGGTTSVGSVRGSIKFEQGFNVSKVELFPVDRSNGLMLLSSNNRIAGQVTKDSITFDLQYISPERPVYGSASLDAGILSVELYIFNPETALTEVARGTFRIYRRWKD